MAKYSKTYVAKVLKEVVANSPYSLVVKDLGNKFFALASNYDIEVTFMVYFKEKDCSYSLLYVNAIHSTPYCLARTGKLLNEIENKLNKKVPIYDYPTSVIKAVEKWFMHNADGISEYEVCKMSPSKVLNYYLEWEGIIGYSYTLEQIFNAKVTYERED